MTTHPIRADLRDRPRRGAAAGGGDRILSEVGDSSDMVKEACGVFGIRAAGQPVSHLTYLGLFALQHRGQESAGMAVSDGDRTWIDKGMGLVSSVFTDSSLNSPISTRVSELTVVSARDSSAASTVREML